MPCVVFLETPNCTIKHCTVVIKASLCLTLTTWHTFLHLLLRSGSDESDKYLFCYKCQGHESQVFTECGHNFEHFLNEPALLALWRGIQWRCLFLSLSLFLSILAHAHICFQSASANERTCHGNRNNVIRSAREVESALW